MKLLDRLPAGSWTPARPDAPARLAEIEQRLGRPLPEDLRELYRTCDVVELLDGRYRFLPFDQIGRIASLQAGDDTEDFAPSTWIAIVDLHDGNYVGLNLVPNPDGTYDWLDCCHDDLGEAAVIASSLDDFLRQALERPSYWLGSGVPRRVLRYENPPSYFRRMHGDRYRSLGDELGPERCTTTGCSRKHVEFSVKCRRHHYEMTQGGPSPFDDD